MTDQGTEPLHYADYLQLPTLLDAQKPVTGAHDEMLFVVTHQAYELWFYQLRHELVSINAIMAQPVVPDDQLITVVQRLHRMNRIWQLLVEQIRVLETMTPQGFLEFRDALVPASGFQSLQFRLFEALLGRRFEHRLAIEQAAIKMRLRPEEQAQLTEQERRGGLFELLDAWLARLPLLETGTFAFWDSYREAVEAMLAQEADTIRRNPLLSDDERQQQLQLQQQTRDHFSALIDPARYEQLRQQGDVRLSHRAMLSALFITLYRQEPLFNLPFQLLEGLVELDEQITAWRQRHALMAQRMLGSKIGTGGSSGYNYLRQSAEQSRIFLDLFRLSTFLLPARALPELPAEIKQALGFRG